MIGKGDAFDMLHGPVGRQRWIVSEAFENNGTAFLSLRSACRGHYATVTAAAAEKAENVETGGAKTAQLETLLAERKAARGAGETEKAAMLTASINALRAELGID